MAQTEIYVVFTAIVNSVCCAMILFHPALFPVFHQRVMLDRAVRETKALASQCLNEVMLNSDSGSVGACEDPHICKVPMAWRTCVLQSIIIMFCILQESLKKWVT